MWNEVEDASCDVVPMPALRLQTCSLGLCCLYSAGFAARYGKPNGSKTWENVNKIFWEVYFKKPQLSDFYIGVASCVNFSHSQI